LFFVIGAGAVVSAVFGIAPGVASAAAPCSTYPAAACTSPGGGGGGDGGGSTRPPVEPVTKAAGGDGAASSLAFTGADIEQMTGIGVGLIAVGGVLYWRSRRRRPASQSS
jgi:hypothetical protein